jgi:glycosyltransferase involved in cell wall biosynthesis
MATVGSDNFAAVVDVPVVSIPQTAAVDRVRVLHLVNGDLYAGAERVQDLLAQRLGEFGFDLSFACLKPGRFALDRHWQAAPLFDVAMRSRFDLSPAARVAKIIRHGNYHLLHTHSPRAAVVGRLASSMARVPMVHHLHSPATADTEYYLRNQVNALVERWSLRRAAALIAVSGSIAEYARRNRLPVDTLTVVHNGVPVEGPLVERATPQSCWTVGTVALFRPRKGLEILLESLAQLRGRGIDVRLRAVGGFRDAAYEAQIKSLSARLRLEGAIDWVGFTRDVIGQMRAMDLFVLPSVFGEGLPMVVLEAMSAGVPVVATRVEGVPEAIRDGIDGLIAAPSDPDDLAQAIARVTSGQLDWQSMCREAHLRQREHFSDRSMAAGVARVYRALLSR